MVREMVSFCASELIKAISVALSVSCVDCRGLFLLLVFIPITLRRKAKYFYEKLLGIRSDVKAD